MITTTIDVYCCNNDILVYSELEQFVVAALCRVLKRNLNNFWEAGMGFFNMHLRVIKLFGEIDGAAHPSISNRGVIKAAMDFRSAKRIFTVKQMEKSKKDQLDHNFMEFLRNKHGDGVLGVSVSFSRLLPKLKGGTEEKDLISRVLEEERKTCIDALRASVGKMLKQCKNNGKLKFVKRILDGEGIDIMRLYRSLCLPLTSASLRNDAGEFFQAELREFISQSLPLSAVYHPKYKSLTDVTADTVLQMIHDEDYNFESFGKLFLVYRHDAKSIKCLDYASVMIGLMLFLTSGDCAESTKDSLMAEMMRTNLASDIPAEYLDMLCDYLIKFTMQGSYIATVIDPLSKLRKFVYSVENILNVLASRIGANRTFRVCLQKSSSEEPLDETSTEKKKLYGAPVLDYFALACGVILFGRIVKVERSHTGASSHLDVELSSASLFALQRETEEELEAAESVSCLLDTLSRKTLKLLSTMNNALLEKLSAPAFECISPGNISFMKYMEEFQNGSVLKKLFERIFAANRQLLAVPQPFEYGDTEELGSLQGQQEELCSEILQCISDTLATVQSEHFNYAAFGLFKLFHLLETQVEEYMRSDGSFQQVFHKSFLQFLHDELISDDAIERDISANLREQFRQLCDRSNDCVDSIACTSEDKVNVYYPMIQSNRVLFSENCFLTLDVMELLLRNYFTSATVSPLSELVSEFETQLPKLFKAVLLPVVDYSCEMWSVFIRALSDELKTQEQQNVPSNQPAALLFFGAKEENVNNAIEDCLIDSSHCDVVKMKVELLQLLSATPLGQSCREFCLWNDLFPSAPDAPSLLSHIATESIELRKLRPAVVFVCFSASTDDCIPLPTLPPTHGEVSQCLAQGNFSSVGTWCLAAVCGCIDKESFVSRSLNVCYLSAYEVSGRRGLQKLFELTFGIVLSVDRSVQFHVFSLCLDSASFASKISVEAVEKHWLENLLAASSKERSATDTIRHLKLVVAMSSQCSNLCFARKHIHQLLHRLTCLLAECDETSKTIAADLVYSQISSAQNQNDDNCLKSVLDSVVVTSEGVVEESLNNQIPADIVDCKAFIAKLLETDFSLAKDSPTAQKLQKALEKIAGDLYSSDVHFVMELVQNADDNQYSMNITPTLKIDMYGHAMVVYNNETGFSPSNITAVCNVGGSTKAGQAGYIGQKGIGFKSIFSVSNSPEIHSNGFHIRFDRGNMIEPIWIDEDSPSSWPEHVVDGEYFGTIIRLNLDDRASQNYAQLNENLEGAFEGKLLLFLNKLKQMELEDKCNARKLVHSKKSLTDSWTVMSAVYVNYPLTSYPEETSYWYIRKRLFNPYVKRNNVIVETTEVAVAFQFNVSAVEESPLQVSKLKDDGEACSDDRQDCDQSGYVYDLRPVVSQFFPVYAFLPTKEHIFHFIIQGDYLLSSSREAIQEGELQTGYSWNKQLLEVTAELVVEVFLELFDKVWIQKFSEQRKCVLLDQIEAHNHLLKISPRDVLALLPRPSKKGQKSLFKHFSDLVYSKLRQLPFFRSRDGIPLIPSCEAISTHLVVFNPRDYMTEDLLFHSTGKRFLDDDLELDNELAELLGVATFDENTVMQCIKSVATNREIVDQCCTRTTAGLMLMMALFADSSPVHLSPGQKQPLIVPAQVPIQVLRKAIQKPAGKMQPSCKHVEALKFCRVWPTTDGRTISLSEDLLFVDSLTGMNSAQKFCFEKFKHLVPLLDDRILNEAAKLLQSGRKKLLDFLLQNLKPTSISGGVAELSAGVIVKRFILPLYEKGAVVAITRELAAAFVGFMYLWWRGNPTETVSGCVVPVLSMMGSNDCWVSDKLCRVKRSRGCGGISDIGDHSSECNDIFESVEVHFGLEIGCSAVNSLSKASIHTALRQMSYVILDPLCAFYACGKTGLSNDCEGSKLYSNVPISCVFSNFSDESSWIKFLRKLGIVNLFDVKHAMSYPVADSPEEIDLSILTFIKHLTRNSRTICTSSVKASATYINVSDSEGNAVVEEDLLPCAKLYLPLFLPFPQDGAVLVSKTVYEALTILFRLVEEELKENRISEVPSFLQHLNCVAWCPAYVHSSIWSLEKEYYVLTSPRNIFMDMNWERAGSSTDELFGPQALYLPTDLSAVVKKSNHFSKAFTFETFQRKGEWVDMNSNTLLTMLEWMIFSQDQHRCYTSEYVITNVYQQLYNAVVDDESKYKNSTLSRWRNLLSGPIIWTPDEGADTISSEEIDPKMVRRGTFLPIEKFVKYDTSNKFLALTGGPVKVLSNYFSPHGLQIMETLFTRRNYCKLCSAVEGMFGVRGGPICGNVRKYSDVSDAVSCTCVDIGFGRFSVKGGLIKKNPSMSDILDLLRFYVLQPGKLQSMKEVLIELSLNTWKCFHVSQALRPYSSESLQTMKNIFSEEELFPTMNGSFAKTRSTKDSVVISVDDKYLWDLFGEELLELNRCGNSDDIELLPQYVWLCAIAEDSTPCDIYFDANAIDYELSEIERDVKELIQLTRSEFSAKTSSPPNIIFYAPSNFDCLLQYLGVRTLSSYMTTTWDVQLVDTTSLRYVPDESSFVSTMNKVLFIAQTFFYNHKPDTLNQLDHMPRLQHLLSLQVQECSVLSTNNVLKICDQVVIEKESTMPYRYDIETSTMYVCSDALDVDTLRKLCTNLVMRAIRTDVAKINNTSDLKLMGDLQDFVRKMITIPESGILGALQVQELYPMPADIRIWKLRCAYSADVDMDWVECTESASVETRPFVDDDKMESALAGYKALV